MLQLKETGSERTVKKSLKCKKDIAFENNKKKKTKMLLQSCAGLLKVTLVKSVIGAKPNHRNCVRGLGLRHIGQTVYLKDNLCVRGMINSASHLLSVSSQKDAEEGFEK
jgi:large subunit ribosomal protein L30